MNIAADATTAGRTTTAVTAAGYRREHGTRAKYVVERCGCLRCRAANADYASRRNRLAAYGLSTSTLVDAAPVRAHVAALQAGGMGWRRIAAAAGVANGAVARLLGHGRPPRRRITPETAARLLAVRLHLAPAARVDATGTVRRLRALVAIGWSQNQLADRIGWTPTNFSTLIAGTRTQVAHQTATRVRALYEHLWDQHPPEAGRGRQDPAARARRYAAQRGWGPPLSWDDDTIDDPAAEPYPSEPGRPAHASRPRRVDLAEAAHLEQAGVHIGEIARRLGVRASSIERARQRANHDARPAEPDNGGRA